MDTTDLSFFGILVMLFLSGIVFICVMQLMDIALQIFEKLTGKSFYQRTHSWEEDGD